MVSDGHDVFVVVDGVRVAKRGRPGTAQARTWVSLEPGWRVLDLYEGNQNGITVEHNGVRVQ
jgi:hypothetical protein